MREIFNLFQTMNATYFGLFDGHASHIVSLIVSKLLHMHVKVSMCTYGTKIHNFQGI